MKAHRRALLTGLLATPFLARAQSAPPQPLERLREPGPVTLTEQQLAQRFTASPAPPGRRANGKRGPICRCRAPKWPGPPPRAGGCM
ncbi:hypothetical protein ACFQU7_19985 [Pseudoroseomonas wenyumeiae]